MIHHVLVPVDGSDRSDHMVWHLQPLLLPQPDVTVTLVHVESPTLPVPQSHIDRLAALLAGTGVRCNQRTVRGEVVPELRRLVAELQPDLLALTSHGAGESHGVYGSVVEEMVRADLPVLTCDPERCRGPQATRVRRVLVFLRHESELSALRPLATELARRHEASILLVAMGPADCDLRLRRIEFLRESAQSLTDEGLETSWTLSDGDPACAGVALATEHEVDLILVSKDVNDSDLNRRLVLESRRPVLSLVSTKAAPLKAAPALA